MNDDDIYDIEVDIKTFEDLKNNGWKINMNEEGEKKYEYFSNKKNKFEEKLLNRIGILGGGKVGKTFILHQLINKDYDKKIKTTGISVIYPEIGSDNYFVCLDTCNTLNTSLYDKNKTYEELFNLHNEERLDLMKKLSKDKKFRNIFIEDFIIKNSNILLIIINQLSFKEQKFLNRLKNNKNNKKMLIIHNLQFFCEKKSIEEYIENVIKKSVFKNLKRINHNLNSKKKNDETYYYKEIEFGNVNNEYSDSSQQIIHLFMGKEGSEAGDYFNDPTIDYIRHLIKADTRTKIFDVINEIKYFLSFNYSQYMIKEDNEERPIEKNDLIIVHDYDDGIYLKCENKNFKLKNCIINEMGNLNFLSENSIVPSFVCYKGRYTNKKKNEEWPALIVKAEMFVEAKDIKISQFISDDNETMNITISCDKAFKKEENIKVIENIDENIKEGKIKINIKVNLKNFQLDYNKQPQLIKPFPGIKIIYFKLKVDENNL